MKEGCRDERDDGQRHDVGMASQAHWAAVIILMIAALVKYVLFR